MADARDFLERMLKPAYQDWLREPLAEHRAKAAAGYANDVAERLFHQLGLSKRFPGRSGPSRYREEIAKHCPDFGLVRDIADGTKHWTIMRATRRISSAGQTSRKQLTIDETDFPVDEIEDWDTNEQLVVQLDDGTLRTLRNIVATVISYWESELQRHGL